jgi:hypothetical protein
VVSVLLLRVYSTPVLGPSILLFSGYKRAISPEVQQLGLEADHSFPSSAEVNNDGAIPPGVILPYFTLGVKILLMLSHIRLNLTTLPWGKKDGY